MATLNVIRRWALREQISIREISRRTGLARNTVKKYLRSDETEPTYAKRASPSQLNPYAEKLVTWLGIEATKSRKQRRNLKKIYTPASKNCADADLGELGSHVQRIACQQAPGSDHGGIRVSAAEPHCFTGSHNGCPIGAPYLSRC